MKNENRGMIHRRYKGIAIAGAALLAAATAALAAGTPAEVCEAGKNDTMGKYAACLAKAEKSFVTSGDATARDDARIKCSGKLAATWLKLEADGACPTNGDQPPIAEFMDSCVQGVVGAVAPGGTTVGLDPLTCAAGLATCQSNCAASVRPPLSSGQTSCYNTAGTVIACASSEQDGALLKGAPHSFTDNGDGTVTDNTTTLMWEKLDDNNASGIHDKDNSYTWANAFAGKVSTLNSTNFAGHNDWRVPNRMELETLVNLGAVAPATFSAFNSGCAPGCTVTTCSCTQSYTYWSSSTYQNYPTYAWGVYFNFGDTYSDGKTNSLYVRAVRAGS